MANRKRKKTNIKSNSERLRVSVYRSNKDIYAQIIDDKEQKTIVSASSMKMDNLNKVDQAKLVGKELAEKAKKQKVEKVIFDRGNYIYRGRVKVLADSIRENGIDF
jgi:large subunit ribosomal protein L18